MTPSETPSQIPPANPPPASRRAGTIFGIPAIKLVFALEYVLQGLANPFQGITYQPFFRHLRTDFGLTEAATQNLFAKSYLAWSFKPLLGFLIDAYGRTRTTLILLLGAACIGFALTPLFDTGPWVFFGAMFVLSLVLAATDVSVDRATVIVGDEEAKATGRPKSTTVGLNQAICWAAIYGTAIVAAVLGGYVAEHVRLRSLMLVLTLMPATVLFVVLRLPRDQARPIPLGRSLRQYWDGLNTGPLLGVMSFFFLFHFQPAMGPLWNNHLLQNLKFTQSQVGISDGASYLGLFVGVFLFARRGVHWQERWGLRAVFRFYIVISIALAMTQYLLVEPWFGGLTRGLGRVLPFADSTVRLIALSSYNALLAVVTGLIRMSTFSLVGAVIPVAAAGSLFAGFMSINNLAYSFSYATGAWLYEHGLGLAPLRAVQESLFASPTAPPGKLAIETLILINAVAYIMSFVAVRLLPDRHGTLATDASEGQHAGPERWQVLDRRLRRGVNGAAIVLAVALLAVFIGPAGLDPMSSVLLTFFGVTLLRKVALDRALARRQRDAAEPITPDR